MPYLRTASSRRNVPLRSSSGTVPDPRSNCRCGTRPHNARSRHAPARFCRAGQRRRCRPRPAPHDPRAGPRCSPDCRIGELVQHGHMHVRMMIHHVMHEIRPDETTATSHNDVLGNKRLFSHTDQLTIQLRFQMLLEVMERTSFLWPKR